MSLKIEIETPLKPLVEEQRDYNQFAHLQLIINICLSVNTIVDLRGAMYELNPLTNRYYDMGFGSTHFWVKQKGSAERLLFVTEKQ